MSRVGDSRVLSVNCSVSFLCLSSACISSEHSPSCRTSVFTSGSLILWLQPQGLTKTKNKICFQHIQSTKASVFSVLVKSRPYVCMAVSQRHCLGWEDCAEGFRDEKQAVGSFFFCLLVPGWKTSLVSFPGRCVVLELSPHTAEVAAVQG